MSMLMTQPNQPFGVSVPQYPKLREFDEELERLTRAVRETEKGISKLERESQVHSRAAQSLGDFNAINTAAAKRAEIAQQIEQAERAKKSSEIRIKQLGGERNEWLHFFADLIVKKQRLVRELAEALPDDQTPPSMVLNGTVKRTRDAVSTELLEVAARLANFSGDPGLVREALEMKKQIAAQRPYVVLENNYVLLNDGRVVSNKEFQRLACEHGSSHPMFRYARSGGYVRGARIDRAEAARLGIS